MPGVAVNADLEFDQGRWGYSYMFVHGPLQTDALGRYTLQGVPEAATVWVQVSAPGLVQQCAVPAVPVHADQAMDVQLVSTVNLSVSRSFLPPPAPGYRLVSGTIFKGTQTGTRPAAGAYIDYSPPGLFTATEEMAAETFSDSEGHYLLCGLPDAESVRITASFGGGFLSVLVPPGASTGVDLAIP